MSVPIDIIRQKALERKRKEMHDEYNRQKASLIAETEKARPSAHKFVGQHESMEDSLKDATVGLVRLEDFKSKREALEVKAARIAARTDELKEEKKIKKKKKKAAAAAAAKLSFADADEDEGGDNGKSNGTDAANEKEKEKEKEKDSDEADEDQGAARKRPKLGKNPNVDTSFLPDREREEAERREREQLRLEWLKKQEDLKAEEIEITYSYWDGSGHRRSAVCKKGDDIGTFLEKCKQQCPELRGVSVDNLMYVKEDLIIPHHYTFYYFIVNRCRGKSGPLFNFDVHDDVRFLSDATVEKDESHAGKVVERSYYNRNRHIFPASRWEVFDPNKTFDKYTIAG